MVKSMLDLRQLETFSNKKAPNCPPHDRERQSSSSLQESPVCSISMWHSRIKGWMMHVNCPDRFILDGGESQEATSPTSWWLDVPTHHIEGRSCDVPRGERGGYGRAGQVNPVQRERERTKVLFYSWLSVSLIVSAALCSHTSVTTRWRSSAPPGCRGEGSAVRARRAAARTAPALWATTAGNPARSLSSMVRPHTSKLKNLKSSK